MGFRIISAVHEGRRIPLSIEDPTDHGDDNYCTILIGRNGTGKSRMLAEICRSFDALDSEPNNIRLRKAVHPNSLSRRLELFYKSDQNNFHLFFNGNSNRVFSVAERNKSLALPGRLIATTITPFDKFPIGKRRALTENHLDEDKVSIYRYLGSKNNAGQLSSTGQMSRVIESLMFASEKKNCERVKLNKVFEFLGYLPTVAVDYDVKFGKHMIEQVSQLGDTQSEEGLSNLAVRAEILKNPAIESQLRQALCSVSASTQNERKCTIEYDFELGLFKSGSLDIFKDVLFLRKLGLLSFSDLRMVKRERKEEISIRDASSGEQAVVLTFLGIASEIEDCSLVIIDEPEISLHPEWQEKFIELLNSTFSGHRGCHFILATHSPLLLTRVENVNCSVVTMDNFTITPAKEFSKKSADYQLAEAFSTPGYRNEYLAREGLAALRLASHRKYESPEFQEKIALLTRMRPMLNDDDPVAQMVDALVRAATEVSQ